MLSCALSSQVTFEGIAGSSYTGDIAIDDVSISSGSCIGQTAPPTLPPTVLPSTVTLTSFIFE